MSEQNDRRVLGALRFLDAATNAPLQRRLRIESSPQARFTRNRSGLYVITAAAGLAAYTSLFERQPEQPDEKAVPFESIALDLTVRDPAEEYLPRLAACRLPRRSNLPRPGEPFPPNWKPGPLFSPVDIPMFRAPAAPTAPNWAVVHAWVANAASRKPLPGALLRVLRNGRPVALGLADERGEALVAVPGLPRITWPEDESGDTVLVSEIDATLEAVWDPQGGKIANPDRLERERATLVSQSFPLKLAAGRSIGMPLLIAVP